MTHRIRPCLLLADVESTTADRLRHALVPEYDVDIASADSVSDVLRVADPDLLIVTLKGADVEDNLRLCERVKAESPSVRILFLVEAGAAANLDAALAAGADEFLQDPFSDAELRTRVASLLRMGDLLRELAAAKETLAEADEQLQVRSQELEDEVARRQRLTERFAVLSGGVARRWDADDFVGQSPALQDILGTVGRLQQTSIPVLITGESGTGKELIARALHYGGTCAEGPFVPVNCSAIPDDLAESLFFGHVRGAFTGADGERSGYFESAHGGSLFLDEISDMPLDLQAKLLRVLEDGYVQPVGAKTHKKVEVRLIAATNVDLQGRLRTGRFREDLYFRLARYPVRVPPLRDRREDIPLLAQHMLQAFAEEIRVDVPRLCPEVLQKLQAYDFPGNVRELRNVIERALIECGSGPVEPQHIHLGFGPATPATTPQAVRPADVGEDMPLDFAEAELILIQRALRQAGGNITEAARLLGVNRTKIYRRLAQNDDSGDSENGQRVGNDR